MPIYSEIDLQENVRSELEQFESSLPSISFGKKLSLVQTFADSPDELDFLKTLVMYIECEQQIKNEILRIVHWRYRAAKARFYSSLLRTKKQEVVLAAIDLITPLKESLIVPIFESHFNLNDIAMSKKMVLAVRETGDPLGINILKECLKSENSDLVILAITTLANWHGEISWKIFRPFLYHPDKRVRIEAGFGMVFRKDKGCACCMIRALKNEKDDEVRYNLIRYAGMIPNGRVIKPLLLIAIHDDDQRARLEASRTLDRLQGVLDAKHFYNIRRHRDIKIRAEIIRRLGKFGTENTRYKKFIRNTLLKSKDDLITQACIQSLGYIADSSDAKLLSSFLEKSPMSSYNALLALTKTWDDENSEEIYGMLKSGLFSGYSAAIALTRTLRLENKDQALGILSKELSPTQRQVILRYILRRKGLGISPEEILEICRLIIKADDNINVRYLSILLLQYAPSSMTIQYLLDYLPKCNNHFEVEATEDSLRNLFASSPKDLLAAIENTKLKYLETIKKYLPSAIGYKFYTSLAFSLTLIHQDPSDDTKNSDLICDIFLQHGEATAAFLSCVAEHRWLLYFLNKIIERNITVSSYDISAPLVELLNVDAEVIRDTVEELLKSILAIKALPRMIELAETSNDMNTTLAVKRVVKDYAENMSL
ncbi:MAG: hypothetical protein HN337_05820 [Deltaproteobacteria bacterium]|jgi:HEAT repeat protein|nr:hypothetical protein [Deltaproteobacteria bacterium]